MRHREIAKLEKLRGSRVVAYITGDRNIASAQIGDDAVRPIFDLLRGMNPVEKIDLFIYSRGGGIEVPWRIASALRQYSETWNVLIPFRANSAATLLALGADRIILGRHGELGPIDPILNIQRRPKAPGRPESALLEDTINVEDVMAYLSFVRERVGLSDQAALAESLGRLAERLDAVSLGSVYRTRSHIRDVALRMLNSQRNPPTDRMETIVDILATRVYAHGHAIGFAEAREMGLSVIEAPEDIEAAMWDLLCAYERDLKLREPLDPNACLGSQDHYVEDATIAVVESTDMLFEFRGQLDFQARRQMPQNLQVDLNLELQLPPGWDPSRLPVEVQGILQELQGQLQGPAHQAVRQALLTQAPITVVDVGFQGGKWVLDPTPGTRGTD